MIMVHSTNISANPFYAIRIVIVIRAYRKEGEEESGGRSSFSSPPPPPLREYLFHERFRSSFRIEFREFC